MFYYTLWYSDECGTEWEREFEAQGDAQAIEIATAMCRGQEGLWSGVMLSGGPTDNEISFNPF